MQYDHTQVDSEIFCRTKNGNMTQSQLPSPEENSKRQHAFLAESKPINSAQILL